MTMQIKSAASSGSSIYVGDIAATMEHRDFRAIKHMLVAAGLNNMTRPITRAELDKKLNDSMLATAHRLTVKNTLERHCLIEDEVTMRASSSRFIDHPEWRSVLPSLRHIGIDERLANGGSIRMSELDATMNRHHLGTSARIALKSALGRLGALDDDDGDEVHASADDGDDGIHPLLRPHLADLRALGLDQHIAAGGKISAHDFDRLLSDAVKKGDDRFRDTQKRILLKSALDSAGVLTQHKFL